MDNDLTRRTFLAALSASAAGVLTGGLHRILAAVPGASGSMSMSKSKTFLLGGDLLVNRLGFGAMRLTGEGIWGWPPDRENAKKVLRRAVELAVNFIDTADAYGAPFEIDTIKDNAISYAKFYSRSHDAVIRVYDDAGNVIETHEHAGDASTEVSASAPLVQPYQAVIARPVKT